MNQMAYQVTLIDTEGNKSTFECAEDTTVLDQADEEGIDAPYSCRAVSYTHLTLPTKA